MVSAFEKNYGHVPFAKSQTDKDLFGKPQFNMYAFFERKHIRFYKLLFKIPEVIQQADIKGIIHCHSKWSDGINSIEELTEACIRSGKKFLVISDHSKTAYYANGLTEDR